MAEQLSELRVEIRKVGNEFFAVTKQAQGQEVCTNRFQHDPTGMTHMGPLWLLERGALVPEGAAEGGMNSKSKDSRADPSLPLTQYGLRLYRYLFGSGNQLASFVASNPAYKQAHLTLALHPEAASLWRLPWEYLHDGDAFLCLNGRWKICRVPEGVTPLEVRTSPLPLRVLVVISAPEDQAALDLERETSVIQEALDDIIRQNRLELNVLVEITAEELGQALQKGHYHILHYIGHGTYSHKQHRGFLCFENAQGQTDALGATQLEPLLTGVTAPQLTILSACQSAQIGVLDAFDNVATGLLQVGAPAVLALPSSLNDESTIEFMRLFYASLAEGKMLVEALALARAELYALDESRPAGRRRFDWGVPAIYLRRPGARLVDLTAPSRPEAPARVRPPAERSINGLELPAFFVGRYDELRKLQRNLRSDVPAHRQMAAISLNGASGIGKSALLAELLRRSARDEVAVHVIHCRALLHPVLALDEIAAFWRSLPAEGKEDAARLLLNTRLDPAERARQALQRLGQARCWLIFDDLDAWLTTPGESQPARIADETLNSILLGFLTARSSATTLVFTGTTVWAGLEVIPSGQRLDVTLWPFTLWPSIQLMNALPRLRVLPLADKIAIHSRLGGYPQLLELLDVWLSRDRTIQGWLAGAQVFDQTSADWMRYFMEDIANRLTPAEREALGPLALLVGVWTPGMLAGITGLEAAAAQELFARLKAWGLLSFYAPHSDESGWYILIPAAREFFLSRATAAQRRRWHTQLIGYYKAPFIQAARRQIESRSNAAWDESQVEWAARSSSGVLGMWLRQAEDPEHAQRTCECALAWRHHLLEAGEPQPAVDITEALLPTLERTERRDLVKVLLRGNITALEGRDRAQAILALGARYLAESRVKEALMFYEQAYRLFQTLNDRPLMAATLGQMAIACQQFKDYNRSIQFQQVALTLRQEMGDFEGQADSLQHLSILYRLLGDSKQALSYNKAALALDQEHKNLAELTEDLYQRGLILNDLEHYTESFDAFRKSHELAQRIGDKEHTADNLLEIGRLLAPQKLREGVAALTEALEIYSYLNNPKAGFVLEALGVIHEQEKQYARALEKYELAHHVFENGLATEILRCQGHIQRVREKMRK